MKDRHIADHLIRAQYRSFDSLIALCLEKQVDFLLIAGDTFDSGERNLTAMLHFLEGMKILHAEGIRVVIVAGNHDPLENRSGAPPVWEYLDHFMGSESLFTLIRSDTGEVIDMYRDGDVIARVCGVSFARKEVYTNPIRLFSPREDDTIPYIGLVHCTIGSHAEHIPYAPCTISDLLPLRFDYWALGHIHGGYAPRDSDPVVRYSGTIQGRTWHETGPKGCLHVTVHPDGRVESVFCDTAPVRFETRSLDISGMEEDDLTSAINQMMKGFQSPHGTHSTILSLSLTGSGPLHLSLMNTGLKKEILDLFQTDCYSPPFCYLADIIDVTTPTLDRGSFRGQGDLFEEIVSVTDSLIAEPGLSGTREIISPLFQHHSIGRILGLLEDEELKSILLRAEEMVLEGLGVLDED